MSQLIQEFDLWRPGYGGALVNIYKDDGVTLSPVFFDEALTQPAPNPQVLDRKVYQSNGSALEYGKFAQSLYIQDAYKLDIIGQHRSGIVRPPVTLADGLDVSKALASIPGPDVTRAVEDWFADTLTVEAFGELGSDSASNTAVIVAAVGYAASNGYGLVYLPAGIIPFTQLVLPGFVQLSGQGEEATILQSNVGAAAITAGGDGCGLRDLTLDGINLVSGSFGFLAEGRSRIAIANVRVKRFDFGAQFNSGGNHRFSQLSADNCNTGVALRSGDLGAGGSDLLNVNWDSGEVVFCTNNGILITCTDDGDTQCAHIDLSSLAFNDNALDALEVFGGRFVQVNACRFIDNVRHVNILDRVDTAARGVHFNGGLFDGGQIQMRDTAQDVLFRSLELRNHEWDINTAVVNPVRLVDVLESGTQNFIGDVTKLRRDRAYFRGQSTKVSKNNSYTTVWKQQLAPGDVLVATALIVGRTIDATGTSLYIRHFGANRAGATLAIKNVTTSFVGGEIVTGADGGTGQVIVASGTSLTIIKITGEFSTNEALSGSLGGAATSNGVLVFADVGIVFSLIPASQGDTPAFFEADSESASRIQAVGDTIEVQVKAATSRDVEWSARVDFALTLPPIPAAAAEQ